MNLSVTPTQAEIDAKVQRLFNLIPALKSGVGPNVETAQRDALAISMELGSLVIGSLVRMAEAQEKMVQIMESEYGPVAGGAPLFRGK